MHNKSDSIQHLISIKMACFKESKLYIVANYKKERKGKKISGFRKDIFMALISELLTVTMMQRTHGRVEESTVMNFSFCWCNYILLPRQQILGNIESSRGDSFYVSP
jgi:hypothetical protein